MPRSLLPLMFALLLIGCHAAPPVVNPTYLDDSPLANQAFLGVSMEADAVTGGARVNSVLPGPLRPDVAAAPGHGTSPFQVQSGDVITVVDGKTFGPDELRHYITERHPGDWLTLRIARTTPAATTQAGSTSKPAATAPAAPPEIHELRVQLASKAQWSGPVSFPTPERSKDAVPLEFPPGPTLFQQYVRTQLDQTHTADGVEQLLNYFAKTQQQQGGYHMLSRIAYGFQHPTRLPDLQRAMTRPLENLAEDPRMVLQQGADNLDVARPTLSARPDLSDPVAALHWAEAHVEEADHHLQTAFARLSPAEQAELPGLMNDLLDVTGQLNYVSDAPNAPRLIHAMQLTMRVDYGALLQAAGSLSGLMLKSSAPSRNLKPIHLPAALAGAVTGDILAAEHVNGRWYVYGGFGHNTYDMSRIDVVIDPGGGDEFRYPSADKATHRPGRPQFPIQVVVDMGGEDHYSGGSSGGGGSGGPGGTIMGVNLIVDYGEKNQYEGGMGSCGAGVLGTGIILNYGGASTYKSTSWSQGAGVYGLGAVIDLGVQAHFYEAQVLSQGVGGPRGMGLLFAAHGRNLFRANGPMPSAYDTPAVFCSFSQGVGTGFRGYDSGGIGMLVDLAGGGRYEGGEFCQGGGYYWGLGICYGKGGDNLYYGNRYCQGWAAHQALGVLANDGGNNTYWGMTAASQGCGWDIAMGMLIDRGGHSSFQAESLSQGSAAMQGIGWLIDLGGAGRFVDPSAYTQGEAGTNEYHFKESGCLSWGMLLNSGSPSYFSSGKPQRTSIATGPHDQPVTEKSALHGLFIDTKDAIEVAP